MTPTAHSSQPLFSPQAQRELTDALKTLSTGLTHLAETLAQEAQILRTNDADALIEIAQEKAHQIDSLEKANLTLSHWLTPGEVTPLPDLITCERFASLPQLLKKQLHQADELARECHQQNLKNGMSIQALNNINTGLINTLVGQSSESQTYDPTGQKAPHQRTSGALGKA